MLGEAAVWRPDKPTPTGDDRAVLLAAFQNVQSRKMRARATMVATSGPAPGTSRWVMEAVPPDVKSMQMTMPDGREISSLVLEGLFRAELRGTLRAQIEQLAPGRLRWRVVPASSVDPEALRRAFRARAAQCLGPEVCLTIELAGAIETTSEGKLVRAIVRGRDATGGSPAAAPHGSESDVGGGPRETASGRDEAVR